jgi:hypothetical protein
MYKQQKYLPSASASLAGITIVKPGPEEVSIVVRHVNERSLDACVKQLKFAFPDSPIRLVSAVPFDSCLKLAFEASLEMRRPWSLHVDADMLCLARPLYSLVEYAKRQRENTFSFGCMVYDRIFLESRYCGLSLYRTKFLEYAKNMIAPAGQTGRPETFVKRLMARAGFPVICTDILVGLHDYEQYYRHIFRKVLLQKSKFSKYNEVIKKWSGLKDADYLTAAIAVNYQVPFHIALNDHLTEEWRVENHVQIPAEKDPLDVSLWNQDKIEQILSSELTGSDRHEDGKKTGHENNTFQLGPVYPFLIEMIKYQMNKKKVVNPDL